MILVVKKTKHYIKSALYSAFFVWIVLLSSGCSFGPETLELSGQTMGTSYHLLVVKPEYGDDSLARDVESLLTKINRQMSTYQQDSELSEINRAELNTWIAVSPELFDVLHLSQSVNGQSGGAFDVTMGPLVNLWGFGPEQSADQLPSSEQITTALTTTGADSFELDVNAVAIKKRKSAYIDLSAVAKGYAADQLAELLESRGYKNYMVEIGGELKVAGKNTRGQLWRLAIEKPVPIPGEVFQAIALTDSGVATSGDYRNYFEVGGQRYSHTIDPLSGSPVKHSLVSVTVIASSAAAADAWATALNVLGGCKGLALAEQLQLAAYFISEKDGELIGQYSQAFSPYLN